MSEFLPYSVDTFLKTIGCKLYELQWLELNKIGTKRTMGVLNSCHRPDIKRDIDNSNQASVLDKA